MKTLWSVLILAAAASPASAQQPAPPEKSPWHRFEFSLGALIADISSSAEVQAGGLGAVIDIEQVLGVDESLFQVRAGASYEIAPRHRLWLDYVDLSRDSTKTLETDIEFGDTVYPVGTSVHTEMDLQLVNLVYGYSLIHDDRVDLAVTFGMHGMRTQLELQGQSIGGESERFFLPIPLPGIRMNTLLSPDLYFKLNLEFLWIRVDQFEGLMVDSMVGLEWAAFEHVGFGVAYNHIRIGLEMEDDGFATVDFQGRLDFDVAGFLLYTVLYF
jgi:hypothetical protein